MCTSVKPENRRLGTWHKFYTDDQKTDRDKQITPFRKFHMTAQNLMEQIKKTGKEKILKMTRTAAWMSLLLFCVLLLPVLYLSFVNRASGDDYGSAPNP